MAHFVYPVTFMYVQENEPNSKLCVDQFVGPMYRGIWNFLGPGAPVSPIPDMVYFPPPPFPGGGCCIFSTPGILGHARSSQIEYPNGFLFLRIGKFR